MPIDSTAQTAVRLLFLALAGCNQKPAAELERHGSTATSAAPLTSRAAAPMAKSTSAPAGAPSALPCVTAESLGLTRLRELRSENAAERSAIGAARRELERVLQQPDEFYATVQSTADIVVLELWHDASFNRDNCDGRANPDDRNRTLSYDVKKGRIVATKVWP